MKSLLIFLALFFATLPSFGQQGGTFNYVKLLPTTLPTYCAAGDLRSDAAGHFLNYCYPTNTWNAFGVSSTAPLTTLGDMMYENATPLPTRLPGNTTTTKKFLTQTGTGTISAVPAWATISTADVPTLNYVNLNGSTPLTGNWDVGAFRIFNLTAPTTSSDAANRNYVDTVIKTTVSGGTGASLSPAIGSMLYASSTSAMAATAVGTAGQVIHGAGAASPTWGAVALTADVSGTLPIANGGTGQTTANAAFNALAPSQTSNSGKYMTTDGSNTSWATVAAGGGSTSGVNYVGLSISWALTTQSDIDFETSAGNWIAFQDAGASSPANMNGTVVDGTPITCARTTTAGHVLDNSGSLEIVKGASSKQGEGCRTVVNIPPGYRGQNAEFTFPFQLFSGALASGDLTVNAYDVTNSALLSMSCNTGSSTVNNQVNATGRVICNGVIPSSTAQIRFGLYFATTATTAATVDIDDVIIQPPSNVGQVSQPVFIGSAHIPGTTTCTWTVTNTGMAAFSTTVACPGPTVDSNPGPGTIQTTDTDLPKFTVNNLPAGTYMVRISGSTGSANTASVAINDGTTTSSPQLVNNVSNLVPFEAKGVFTYTSTGNITFQLYGSSGSGVSAMTVYNNTATIQNLNFEIYRWPTSTETAFRADQVPAAWSGYTTVSGGCSTASATFADVSACTSIALTEITNSNFGTVTTAGSSLPGITFTPAKIGTYSICASVYAADSAISSPTFRMVNGSTIMNPGMGTASVPSASYAVSETLCGDLNITSIAATTVKLQAATNVGTLNIQNSNASGSAAITWTIKQITANTPQPYFMGGVTSSSSGVERIDRATATHTADATCAISQQSGSWLSSVSCSVAGKVTLNIAASEFSSTPDCVCSRMATATGECAVNPVSSTQVDVYMGNSSGTATDLPFSVHCMGPH